MSCRRIAIAMLVLAAAQTPALAGELTLTCWNILNFPGSTGYQRGPYFRTVLAEIQPDILVVQEMYGQSGVNQFLSDILDTFEPDLWAAAPHHDGYDSDRSLFYRDDCVEVLGSGWLDTALRDIDWWDLRVSASYDTFRLYTLHLKASQGGTNEQRRYAECLVLRADLDALPPGTNYIVAGDFNIYYSDEPAWQLIRSEGPGQLLDPINQEGYWHNNPVYAPIHTQSTRTTQFGGGATGGLDDRFDFIVVGDELLDGSALDLLPDTYHSFGNDGDHFNLAIIDGDNGVVTPEVANALHEASDHLPVVTQLSFTDEVGVPAGAPAALLLQAWPNPFNPATRLRFTLPQAGELELTAHDISGRRLETLLATHADAGPHEMSWRPTGLPSGLYLLRLRLDGEPLAALRLVLLK